MRKHTVISSWCGIVDSRFPCKAFPSRDLRVSLRSGCNRWKSVKQDRTIVDHSFREMLKQFFKMVCSTPLSGAQLPLACEESSLALECSLTRTSVLGHEGCECICHGSRSEHCLKALEKQWLELKWLRCDYVMCEDVG